MPDQYQASASDLAAVRAICERHGFCLIKGVLARSDLEGLLTGMKAATQRESPRLDLLGIPELRHIYFDHRLLDIGRALMGPQLVYDGESTFNFEETIGSHTRNPYTELHCDAKGQPDNIGAVWRSPTDAVYQAYRFGIYFQDYRRASGALKVIVGSHRGDPAQYKESQLLSGAITSRAVGGDRLDYPETTHPLYNLPSEPGDVVVWNLRTFHSAGARLFIADPTLAVHPTVEAAISEQAPHLFAPPPGPRNAIFFDYAAPCEEIDLYIKFRARPTEDGLAPVLDRRSDDPAVLALATQNGVTVRHDGLITALAMALTFNGTPHQLRTLDAAATKIAAKRLYALLSRHEEYSSHFPLFDRVRFAQAPDPNGALNGAMREIVGKLLTKTGPA